MANFERLKSPENQKIVYASNNPKLIADYENAIVNAGRLQGTIETTVGAWNAARRTFSAVTDVTSTGIGDAIDQIRSWFGYDPAPGFSGHGMSGHGMSSLSAVQLVPAIWMTGIVAAAVIANNAMKKVFILIKASQLERNGMSPAQAAIVARDSLAPQLFGGLNKVLIASGALALFLMLRK